MSVTTIPVSLSSKRVQRLYDVLSYVYDFVTLYEIGPKKKALEIARINNDFRILEVGFGTGKTTLKLAKKLDNGLICGLDISSKMTNKALEQIKSHDLTEKVNLFLGDAGSIPFASSSFDLIFSSYMLDLIDTPILPIVLSEFRRVLKPDGQLIIISLSKGSKWYNNMHLYEWLYKRWPLILGGCRPVDVKPYLNRLQFKIIYWKFVLAGYLMPTEIIYAKKDVTPV
jgi:ubiquinone/menaquinone biosynthesis C-methylase UbiE